MIYPTCAAHMRPMATLGLYVAAQDGLYLYEIRSADDAVSLLASNAKFVELLITPRLRPPHELPPRPRRERGIGWRHAPCNRGAGCRVVGWQGFFGGVRAGGRSCSCPKAKSAWRGLCQEMRDSNIAISNRPFGGDAGEAGRTNGGGVVVNYNGQFTLR